MSQNDNFYFRGYRPRENHIHPSENTTRQIAAYSLAVIWCGAHILTRRSTPTRARDPGAMQLHGPWVTFAWQNSYHGAGRLFSLTYTHWILTSTMDTHCYEGSCKPPGGSVSGPKIWGLYNESRHCATLCDVIPYCLLNNWKTGVHWEHRFSVNFSTRNEYHGIIALSSESL